MLGKFAQSINLKKTCAEYRVGLWQCPQFLFLIMGVIIILSIIVTYVVASRYQDPEIAALTVLMLAAILFAIGNLIVRSFEQIALSARSKSEFISIMSHQLRSPLSAIKWQINLLLSDNPPRDLTDGSLQKYLGTVYDQNERMIRAVNDLLEVNRIEDNDLVLRPAPFSLLGATEKILAECKNAADQNNLTVTIASPENLPLALGDEERVRHVIEHLVDNSVKYSPSGGKISIALSNENTELMWKITDHGSGISPKDQSRIFEKFFRSDNAMRYHTEGSGVGLFIARAIIKKSGGNLGFSSELNKGSIFWFTLPKGGQAMPIKK